MYKPYLKYKDSEIDWLGEVPEHWTPSKIKKACTLTYGDSLSEENRNHGEVPVYGSNGIVGKHDSSNTLYPVIVVGRKGSYGKLNYSTIPVFAIDTTYYIDQRNTNCNIKWLFYILSCLNLDEGSKDSAVPGLSRDDFYKHYLPKCSSHEQQAIASYLDDSTSRIDALIEKKEQMIELLKEKRIALITHAVTKGLDPNVKMKDSGIEWLGEVPEHWVHTVLSHVCNIQGGFAFDSNLFSDEGHSIVQMSNLKRGTLDLSDAKKYPFDLCPREVELKENDILIGMSGSIGKTGSLGNYAVVSKSDLPCYLNQRVGRFNMSTKLYSNFLAYIIQATPFFEQVQLSVTGTAQFNISPSELGNIWIAIPPIIEQKMIAKHLDKETSHIDTLIQKQEQMIELLSEYRSSLIHHAVTGKIDLRGYHAKTQ